MRTIKQARKAADVTQKQIAEILGVSLRSYQNHENETPHKQARVALTLDRWRRGEIKLTFSHNGYQFEESHDSKPDLSNAIKLIERAAEILRGSTKLENLTKEHTD